MHKVNKTEKPKPSLIQVTEKDGEVVKIGKYDSVKKLLRMTRTKSEHLMEKYNAWGLDAKVVDFLILEGNASIIVKDTESKWEFKCEAGDFKLYGILEENKQFRPQYFLSLDHWEVIRASNRSYIIRCDETSCKHNLASNCLRGVISIGSDGACANYEDIV